MRTLHRAMIPDQLQKLRGERLDVFAIAPAHQVNGLQCRIPPGARSPRGASCRFHHGWRACSFLCQRSCSAEVFGQVSFGRNRDRAGPFLDEVPQKSERCGEASNGADDGVATSQPRHGMAGGGPQDLCCLLASTSPTASCSLEETSKRATEGIEQASSMWSSCNWELGTDRDAWMRVPWSHSHQAAARRRGSKWSLLPNGAHRATSGLKRGASKREHALAESPYHV